MKKTSLIILLFIASITYCSDTTKVLFVGNSYTYFNDLPDLFKQLSQSSGKNVITDMSAPGGYTLDQHYTTQATLNKINSQSWNYVVLQEQSQYPTIEYYRIHFTNIYAVRLDSVIKANSSQTMFYMTWGRKIGGQQCIGNYCSTVFTDYFHMQDSLSSAYTQISQMLNAKLSPVGLAWKKALIQDPNADLWDMDGSHPSIRGSYLAACMFYVTVFNESPEGLHFYAGLDSIEAKFYQQIAGSFIVGVTPTGNLIPDNYYLGQNYPNPFNPSTTILFSIPVTGLVNITVYDILGRVVNTALNSILKPGNYEVVWDGNNYTSGIYYYTITVNEFTESRKMILIK